MAAASSSGDIPLKYDVFISFRGEDTRKGFTNTLFHFLKNKGIDTFIDDGLPRGQQIEASLIKTIEESMIAVVVFSKNYASSSWCLDELVKMREFNLVIMPIFYDVKPDQVLELSGEFGKEFEKLKSPENEVKIKQWSEDLAFVATQAGWDLNNYSKEIDVVKEVAAQILKYLDSVFVSTCSSSRYIGIASLVDDLKRLLKKESSGVQFYGLWGMGGIGKTTIANALYHQLSPQFDGSYFCPIDLDEKDVRKLADLRNRMISRILNETYDEGAPDQPSARVLSRLQKKKVLIVLDNVSTSNQVTTLVGSKANPWFAFGSKIIITSRDSQVLKNEVSEFQEIKEMSRDFSLRLFCLRAFKQNQPPDDEDYVQFSNRMVNYTKGLPLALELLGCDLYGRTKDQWRNTLETLETRMDRMVPDIEKVLMISYDNLSEIEKERFLDIACFFKGYNRDWVKDILGGIAHLIDKCLVTENPDNTLGMHDLLQKMGQDIAEEQKRKRIWRSFDSYNLLQKMGQNYDKEQSRLGMRKRIQRSFDSYSLLGNYQEASKAIEGIFLNMDDDRIKMLNIHPMIFSKMQNLRLLIILQKWGRKLKIKIQNDLSQSSKDFYGGIQFLPNDLRLLFWDNYPSEFLPSNFSAKNLVFLTMRHCKLRRLWKEVKRSVNLKNLKVLDLSYSKYFTTLPDLTSAAKLEEIILDECEQLLEIPASIQHLQSLSILSLRYCIKLCDLPSLASISTLRKLDLCGCKGLKEFPETSKDIQKLILLGTSVVQWPDSMSCLNNLKILELPNKLKKLPCTLHLDSLEELTLFAHDMQVFLEIMGHLWNLDLSGTKIKVPPQSCLLETLPNNFFQLNCPEEGLFICKVPLRDPLAFSCLNFIKDSYCIARMYCNDCRARMFPWVCTLFPLHFWVHSNNDLVSVPIGFIQLYQLEELYMSDCEHRQSVELPWQTTSSDIADDGLLIPHVLSFAGCERLGEGARRNIVEKTMMRIRHVANKKDEVRVSSLTVSLPGNKIPEFFENRYASSATVELPPDFSSSTFRGLVVGFIAYSGLYVGFQCILKKADGSYLCSFKESIIVAGCTFSGTLCLHYLPSRVIREYCKDNLKDATHATFSFLDIFGSLSEVQECGIHLVYVDHEV